MPTTAYTDVTSLAASIQARTTSAGAAVDDVNGAELRLYAGPFTPGVLGVDDFKVVPGAGLSVNVGNNLEDLAIVVGLNAGQGKYSVRLAGSVPYNIALTAAHGSLARIDEIYLLVEDNIYDASGRALPRLAKRTGDAAASPAAPGPDSSWDAHMKLATIAVAAGATSLTVGNITNNRARMENAFVLGNQDQIDDLISDIPDLVFAQWDDIEVDGSVEVAASAAIAGGATATVATVNLTIPAAWGSWKCEAYATFLMPGIHGSRVRIDGTDQQELITADAESRPGAVGGRRTGMTTTGSRQILLRIRNTSGGSNTCDDIYLYARAVRTS